MVFSWSATQRLCAPPAMNVTSAHTMGYCVCTTFSNPLSVYKIKALPPNGAISRAIVSFPRHSISNGEDLEARCVLFSSQRLQWIAPGRGTCSHDSSLYGTSSHNEHWVHSASK